LKVLPLLTYMPKAGYFGRAKTTLKLPGLGAIF
jgi:hypothetical protein